MTEDRTTKWYDDGLQFTCTRCGNCCTGEPGYVWVDHEEIESLAQACEQDVESFERQYVRKVGKRKSLRERTNGDCVFYRDGQGCTVYAQRPRQCRSWPFWESNLETPESWADTCQMCPGAGKGKLYSLTEIEDNRKIINI